MKHPHLLLFAAGILCAHAGEPASPAPAITPTPEASDWKFLGAVYAPMMGLDGNIGVAGLSTPVDIPFKDILEDLDGGFTAAMEVQNGKWSFIGDFIWLKMSDSATPTPTTYVGFKQEEILASAALGYEIYGNDQTRFDFLIGGALTDLDAEIHANDYSTNPVTRVAASGSQTWIDPFVGLRLRHQFSNRWGCFARLDYGGFGVSSDEYWQGLAGINYRINDRTSLALAYRAISVDYQQGGFSYDTETSGPNLGLVIRF